MDNIKKNLEKYRMLFLAGAAVFCLMACQPAANKESEKPVSELAKPAEEAVEEKTVEQPKEETKVADEKTEKTAEATETKEEKPEEKAPSRQSTLMLEYTGKPWSPELEEVLKDLDFSGYGFDVNRPVQIQDINNLYVLANKANYFPEYFEPIELVEPQSKHAGNPTRRKLRKVAADAIDRLLAAARAEGLDIQTVSGYRTIAYQKILYQANVERQGVVLANQYSSKPGHSEHHTGLCMDVSSPSVGFDLIEAYIEKKEGKWLAENAHKYGFIIRYPKGKEEWTGYSYEPWHIRYLGEPLAAYLYETGLCYEEFLGLQQGKRPEEIRIRWETPENAQTKFQSAPVQSPAPVSPAPAENVPQAQEAVPMTPAAPAENPAPAENASPSTDPAQSAPAAPTENSAPAENTTPSAAPGQVAPAEGQAEKPIS